MITKNDVLLLLGELEENGVETASMLQLCIGQSSVNPVVIKFINAHRPFESNKFYEKLRKSYNQKRSDLYINLMKEDLPSEEVLITLCSYNLQAMLFSRNVDDKQMFLRHVRFDDVCKVLYQYNKTYDLLPCIKLLQLIKADIKAFKYFSDSE